MRSSEFKSGEKQTRHRMASQKPGVRAWNLAEQDVVSSCRHGENNPLTMLEYYGPGALPSNGALQKANNTQPAIFRPTEPNPFQFEFLPYGRGIRLTSDGPVPKRPRRNPRWRSWHPALASFAAAGPEAIPAP